jgi:cytochrome c biogenesis protein CcdA/thiol-disulfide isomerase/thioredoxin
MMWLFLLAFLGGALTIVSPCILPVLPFVFARSDQPFVRSTAPLLAGMALTFAAIATLAAVGGGWAVRINSAGRTVALVLMAAFGLALVWPRLADWIAKPFVGAGNRILAGSSGERGALQSFLVGVATGLLWAPCAGPILGLILTGAALNGPNAGTTTLLFAYALGAVVSLAIAAFAGGRLLAALKRSLGGGEWVRRGLGVAVIAAVVAIALGWDTGLLTRLSFNSTSRIEQTLIDSLPGGAGPSGSTAAMTGPAMMTSNDAMTSNGQAAGAAMTGAAPGAAMTSMRAPAGLAVEGALPPLDGAVAWLNSPPLTREQLRGHVVLIDFWTYSCINCLRALPYVTAWHQRYRDKGLVVIGVHTPEFAFEKDERNVRRAAKELDVDYPVALDNDYAIWKAFRNRYWPAHYFIDAEGRIRGHHFGEGNYAESERIIRELLAEAGARDLPPAMRGIEASGVQRAADDANVASPETYVGYARAEGFASPGGFDPGRAKAYAAPDGLRLNQWALAGSWVVREEDAALATPGGSISFRFHARDLHLVLGPGRDGKPVAFRVTVDGAPPGSDAGSDVDADGRGVVREQRLYQLIRQSDGVRARSFTIEFEDAGVQAFAFTFG